MNSNIRTIVESAGLGPLNKVSAVYGGSINDAFYVETAKEKLFLKVNDADRFPRMFESESAGLVLLSETDFMVPKPIHVGKLNEWQFIAMEWIERGSSSPEFWRAFGQNLANLHLLSAPSFGLDHDNYIGSLRQSNRKHTNWSDFYREERLLPQMKLAEDCGLLTAKMQLGFEQLFSALPDIYPIEDPSLVHGDLWSGNMMASSGGKPCIFDPAVYYGHREMDLAMMELFGGFGNAWIDSYNEVYPLENGWQERISFSQLYPLMVHVNLFGGGYVQQVEHILNRLQ